MTRRCAARNIGWHGGGSAARSSSAALAYAARSVARATASNINATRHHFGGRVSARTAAYDVALS